MRRAFIGVAVWLLALTAAFGAEAQQIRLSDGTYPSTAVYLQGTWKWERAEPRQTVIMRFGRDNSFFFHNFTIDRQHWGSYSAAGGKLSVVVTRTCDDKGTTCENRNPPLNVEYPIVPSSANVFQSESERWERMK
jgi:hypothetical protein